VPFEESVEKRTQNSDSTAKPGISQNCYGRFHGGKIVMVTVTQILAGMDVFAGLGTFAQPRKT
jgi:hypothetical protein